VAVGQRAGLPRGIAIAVVFAGFVAALAGGVALLVRPVARQVAAFQADLPRLVASANTSLESLQTRLDEREIGILVKRPGETALETLQATVLRGSGDVVAFTRDLVTQVAEAGFVLILILVIAVYMLLYGQQIGILARTVMPPGDGTIDDDYPARVQRAVFGYVRGQLTFSVIMGFSAGVSLWIFGALGIFPPGRSYAVFFGVFYGLMELIPYLGPVLGAAPPVLVALFQGEPLTALWLVLLFVALQQVEGHIVAPLIFGHSLRINPLLVIFALLLGGHLQGIPGALLALPLAAIVRETLLYLHRHLVMEPWGTPTAAALREHPVGPPLPAPQSPGWGTALSARLVGAVRDRTGRRRERTADTRPSDSLPAAQDPPHSG
jgi:predicted PurR-regulated permease PerM